VDCPAYASSGHIGDVCVTASDGPRGIRVHERQQQWVVVLRSWAATAAVAIRRSTSAVSSTTNRAEHHQRLRRACRGVLDTHTGYVRAVILDASDGMSALANAVPFFVGVAVVLAIVVVVAIDGQTMKAAQRARQQRRAGTLPEEQDRSAQGR